MAVKKGESLYFIELDQVVYFKGEGSVIKAIDVKGKSNIICENSLLELQAKLSPSDFFRINRSEIVHKKYIRRIESYTKSSVAVYFQDNQISLVTSQSNTSAFREWLVN
ncbi:MAG: LytTR family transcriptional regulator DNA-binding domain-containing protein [Bacteroidetes bacterium]|nr:LytTR family transcriptional regulator DNA-binding domain-containing protein [Bacteroidota bacterium]